MLLPYFTFHYSGIPAYFLIWLIIIDHIMIRFEDFQKIDIRTGTIISAEVFEKAKIPAYQLQIDFGPLGILRSSAQLTVNYSIQSLVGKKVIAVVNFPEKQIANFFSQCLVLGVVPEKNDVILLGTSDTVPDGTPIT